MLLMESSLDSLLVENKIFFIPSDTHQLVLSIYLQSNLEYNFARVHMYVCARQITGDELSFIFEIITDLTLYLIYYLNKLTPRPCILLRIAFKMRN